MRKRIDHWCSVVPEKSQPSGPPFWWETQQASFPTGRVGPRDGIYLSPLNTNDGFYLSHIPVYVPACGKKTDSRTLAARRSVTSLLYLTYVTMSHLSVSGFSGSLVHVFKSKIRHSVVSKKKIIIRVRMG